MTITRTYPLYALLAVSLFFAACADNDADKAAAPDTTGTAMQADTMGTMGQRMARATLAPTEGNDAEGTVAFTKTEDGILVEASVSGLSEGEHGIHIHENGDCSAPDASSAGGHFNPQDTPHGAPTNEPSQRHVGDLGNLEANAEGMAEYSRTDSLIAFDGPNSIIGKAVIVHQGADDFTSQPSGNAGPRVACGVIQMSEGAMQQGMTPDTTAQEGGDMEDGDM